MIKLKDIYLFKGINREFVDKIIDNSRRVNYNKGDYILKQGDKSNNEAYIIQKGKVSVEIGGKNVNFIEEGGIFGEIALITDEPRTASIKAEEDLILLKINKELLYSIIKDFENGKEIQDIIKERIKQNLNIG